MNSERRRPRDRDSYVVLRPERLPVIGNAALDRFGGNVREAAIAYARDTGREAEPARQRLWRLARSERRGEFRTKLDVPRRLHHGTVELLQWLAPDEPWDEI